MADNQLRGAEVQDCPAIRVTQNAGCPSIRIRITGGGETPEAPLSDVNFYDYDGKRVASYTAADFAALTEMPANPSHQGLTAQGWNWSLADAQAYVAANGELDIGQQYITDDGKTRLYISIPTSCRRDVPIYFSQTVANGVTVDWGDGSATETAAGTGNQSLTHTYAAPGDYIITLDVTSGTATLGQSGAVIGQNLAQRVYSNYLIGAEIGESVLLNKTFNNCFSLLSVSIPNGITEITENAFNGAYSIRAIIVPSSVTRTRSSAFSSCRALSVVSFPKDTTIEASALFSSSALRRVSLPPAQQLEPSSLNSLSSLSKIIIPHGMTTIGDTAFRGCITMAYVVIPSTVTSIGAGAFQEGYGVEEYHFKGTTPPTITATTFTNIPADCKIYVPASAVATYQGATNWSTYASQIVGE